MASDLAAFSPVMLMVITLVFLFVSATVMSSA